MRKLAHMTVFGILARLIARALTKNSGWPWKTIFGCSLAFACLYACTDEYHQTFVAGGMDRRWMF